LCPILLLSGITAAFTEVIPYRRGIEAILIEPKKTCDFLLSLQALFEQKERKRENFYGILTCAVSDMKFLETRKSIDFFRDFSRYIWMACSNSSVAS
jgi:hypothetical protein